jgi:hypothetical protein
LAALLEEEDMEHQVETEVDAFRKHQEVHAWEADNEDKASLVVGDSP